MARVTRPTDNPMQLALIDTSKGDRYKAKADEWVRRNPQAWAYIRNEAVERTERRKRFGIGELCEQVRWHMKAGGVDDFKVNNNYRAALARRLIAEYPPCRDYIQTRDSCVDLAEAWR